MCEPLTEEEVQFRFYATPYRKFLVKHSNGGKEGG